MEIVHVAILVIVLFYNTIVNHILGGYFFAYTLYRTTNTADIKLCLLGQQTDYETIADIEKYEHFCPILRKQQIFDNLFGTIFEFAAQETTMRVCFQNNNIPKSMPITYTIIQQDNNKNAVCEIQKMPNRRMISLDALDALVHLFWHRIQNFVFKPKIVFNLTINVIISPTRAKNVVDQRYNTCCNLSDFGNNVSSLSTSEGDQCFFINAVRAHVVDIV